MKYSILHLHVIETIEIFQLENISFIVLCLFLKHWKLLFTERLLCTLYISVFVHDKKKTLMQINNIQYDCMSLLHVVTRSPNLYQKNIYIYMCTYIPFVKLLRSSLTRNSRCVFKPVQNIIAYSFDCPWSERLVATNIQMCKCLNDFTILTWDLHLINFLTYVV